MDTGQANDDACFHPCYIMMVMAKCRILRCTASQFKQRLCKKHFKELNPYVTESGERLPDSFAKLDKAFAEFDSMGETKVKSSKKGTVQ